MLALLLTIPVSAAPFDGVQVVKKEKTNLDRYNWCQKRFDKGWTWDRTEKKCVNPKPSSYNWCQKRMDHGWTWDKTEKKCVNPGHSKKGASLELYGGEVIPVHGWKKRYWRRRYYRPRDDVVVEGDAAPLGFYGGYRGRGGYRAYRRGPVVGYRRGYRRGWRRGRW